MHRSIQTVLAVGLTFSFGLGSAADANLNTLTVRIHVFDGAGVGEDVLSRARRVASGIYENARIKTTWPNCFATGGKPAESPGCPPRFGSQDLVLKILPAASPALTGSADVYGLALVLPDGGFSLQAYVFFDRVAAWTPKETWLAAHGRLMGRVPLDEKTPLILGVVMAHELGHLLLGRGAHSQMGIMQPDLSRSDLEQAWWGTLGFPPAQASQLQSKVRSRLLAAQGS